VRLASVALLGTLTLWTPGTATAEPLTLATAIATARRNHPDVRVARATEDIQRAQAGIALSGYLPDLALNALGRGDLSNFAPVVVGTAASGTSTTFPFQGSMLYSASLGLSQLVFDGGKTIAQIAGARAQVVAARHDRSTQELTTEASVTAAFFATLSADAQLVVSTDYEAQQRAQATSIRKLVTGGLKPEVDAIRAETRAQQAALDRIRADGETATQRAALIAALGMDQDPGYKLVDAFTLAVPEENRSLDELTEAAMRARPELRSLEAQRRVAEQQIRAIRSDYLPSLGLALVGSMTGNNKNPNPLFDFFATLTLQEQFFSGLATYRGMQATHAALESVRAKIAGERATVRAAVASARAVLDTALRADQQARSLVEQADRLVKSTQKRYDAGLLTLLELSDAQAQRVLALGQRVSAHYAVALSRADLRRAVGGTILDGEVLR
jgi:outer membrane protein